MAKHDATCTTTLFSASVCLCLMVLASTPAQAQAQAQAERDGVADALAGHQAEMNQLAGKDPMRRPLFFDPVDFESTPAGVPCDHLARRKPEAIAGPAQVVLMETVESPPRRLRYWHPPGAGNPAEAAEKARHFAIGQVKNTEIQVLGSRNFLWCR